MNPAPTIDEIEAIIARDERIRDKWRGHPGYARTVEIGLEAMAMLRASVTDSVRWGEQKIVVAGQGKVVVVIMEPGQDRRVLLANTDVVIDAREGKMRVTKYPECAY